MYSRFLTYVRNDNLVATFKFDTPSDAFIWVFPGRHMGLPLRSVPENFKTDSCFGLKRIKTKRAAVKYDSPFCYIFFLFGIYTYD